MAMAEPVVITEYGDPFLLTHFDTIKGFGKLAVSLREGQAIFTTPTDPFDILANPIMLSIEDRKALAEFLLREDY